MLSKVLIFAFIFLSVIRLNAQQVQSVDFTKARAAISIEPYGKTVEGTVTYYVDILKKTDSLYLDAQHMEFSEVRWNGKKIQFKATEKYLILSEKLTPSQENVLSFHYKATPKKTMYFIGWEYTDAKKQVWTQGQGKYTSNWLPSIDDVNEKIVFSLSISFPKGYTVISNGVLADTLSEGKLTKWNYQMDKPMSSYLLAVAAGKYKYKELIAQSGKKMYLYYYPEQPERFEPTYRYSKEIFDFLENEIGVSFPWQNYKQIPVKDFMYGGMENTTVTIYNDSYYIDSLSFIDRNYVNVNAHELAHHWFGDMVTEQGNTDHWLQEGFATYYAWLADKEIFGAPYFDGELYDAAIQLKAMSDGGKGESVLNPEASSLTFYQKGGWALLALQDLVGRNAFRTGLKNYLNKYQFKNVTTDNFLDEIKAASGKDLTAYKKIWLEEKRFPFEEAMRLLEDNRNLPQLIQETYKDTMSNPPSVMQSAFWEQLEPEYKEKIISYRYETIKDSFYIKSILNDKNIGVRQQYLIRVSKIPPYMQKQFELYLSDPSYITQEDVLYKLWSDFPEKRNDYLDKTSDIYGFNDCNIRILWLVLALATPDYNPTDKHTYFQMLTDYTSPKYGFNVRQKAFEFINELQAFTNENLKDLMNGCFHHSWGFASSCRALLETLLKEEDYKERFKELLPNLSEKEQNYLKSKL